MKRAITVAAFLCFQGCDPAPDVGPDPHVVLSGAVEKGPCVLGTTVNVAPVSAAGNPTGETYSVQTQNDLGEFSVEFDYVGLVSILGEGFYYNEVTGSLSTAPLSLRGYHEVVAGGAQVAYLNVLTHLAADRTRALLQGGAPFATAIAQAETELRGALAIGPAGYDPGARGSELNILGGPDARNAYLLAVSAVLAQAALIEAGGEPSDAVLQELLNRIALDLADDGAVTAETAAQLAEAERQVDGAQVMADLGARLASLGSTAVVPDIESMLDTDGDGTVNAEDTDDDGDGVLDPDEGVAVVIAGQECSFAIEVDGTIWAWGRNDWGYLGDGTTEDRLSPTRIAGVPRPLRLSSVMQTAIAAADGTVWWWGQLPNSAETRPPAQVPGLINIVTLDVWGFCGIAIDAAGQAFCWPIGGDTPTVFDAPPLQVVAWGGFDRGLALAVDGSV